MASQDEIIARLKGQAIPRGGGWFYYGRAKEVLENMPSINGTSEAYDEGIRTICLYLNI